MPVFAIPRVRINSKIVTAKDQCTFPLAIPRLINCDVKLQLKCPMRIHVPVLLVATALRLSGIPFWLDNRRVNIGTLLPAPATVRADDPVDTDGIPDAFTHALKGVVHIQVRVAPVDVISKQVDFQGNAFGVLLKMGPYLFILQII